MIGHNCRSLKNLALAEMCHFIPVESHQCDPSLFAHLKALELWTVVGVQLPNNVVKQLLASCSSVQNLLFRNCDDLNDTLLNELWTVISFPSAILFYDIRSATKACYPICSYTP